MLVELLKNRHEVGVPIEMDFINTKSNEVANNKHTAMLWWALWAANTLGRLSSVAWSEP